MNALFLHAHFAVERAREAALWAWAVARVGATDDMWGAEEQRRAWAELGGAWGAPEVLVRAGHRETLVRERVEGVLARSGLGGLGATSYVFCASTSAIPPLCAAVLTGFLVVPNS